MFSQISKYEMEFYLDIIYWENILFTEISIIINNHFNVLSEEDGKNTGSAAFPWRSAIMSFSPFPDTGHGTDKPASYLCRQPCKRGQHATCPMWSCPGHNTSSHCPLCLLDKSCSSSLRTICRTKAVPFLWMTAIYHR